MQAIFCDHLAPGAEAPFGLIASPQPHRRFAVYRNNVFHSLITALKLRFPAIEQLIGSESFQFCAQLFVQSHKPRTPVLMSYGDEFPDFLGELSFLTDWPFLVDVARIEVARTQAYHARDCVPFRLTDARSETIEALFPCYFSLHPAAIVLSSPFPAATIWEFSGSAVALMQIEWQPQTIAVTRGHYDVQVFIVPDGTAQCLAALEQGLTLEDALNEASNSVPDCDLSALLVSLLRCDLLAMPSLSSSARKDTHDESH